ncbi:MAG TPA: SAM-dependent methyltransferase [Rhizomicrobium sp.]|nr:SAM-dependent methyltransferase [Rhizomicrobium sp.]
MHATEHSRTAEYMALFRALETAQGAHRRLFDDPWAARFLRPSLKAVATLARVPAAGRVIANYIDRRWPGGRSSGIARTRYIDDMVEGALKEGVDQIVILGAGFDCRAYRLAATKRAHVFEVDHPNTSRMKQERVRAGSGKLPAHVTYVAIDFNTQNLADGLSAAGFDAKRPAFFVWEGVTQYLDAAAVDGTFRFIASAAPGSEILFTYVEKGAIGSDPKFAGMEALRKTLKEVGEVWKFGFYPDELADYLAARGLKLVSDLDATQYRALYMGDRPFKGYEYYHVAVAEVAGTRAQVKKLEYA